MKDGLKMRVRIVTTKNIKAALGDEVIAKSSFTPMVYDLESEDVNLSLCRKRNNAFLDQKTIVLLGMGTDGHTASLFQIHFQLKWPFPLFSLIFKQMKHHQNQ